jgi:hypothetical protein
VPVKWSIVSDDQFVEIHVWPDVKLEEIRDCFAAIIGEGALPFRKLVDLSFAPLALGTSGIRAIGERARELAKTVPLGPVAVVVTSELAEEVVAVFNRQVALERPLRVFRDVGAARAWLKQQPVPR